MQYKLTSKGYIPLNEKELVEYNNRQDKWELEADDRAAEIVRKNRNKKLTSCDWTQVADAQVDQEAWATYRQALRDIPSQEGFPNTINWPTEP